MKPNNPFVLVGYQGDAFFCDREQETEKLLSWIRNDSNVTLMAPRRYGKTGLLHHTARHPFYNSTDMMTLGLVDPEKYADFARAFFVAEGKPFDVSAFRYLYDRFGGVTWYVQRVLNWIWNLGTGLDGTETVDAAVISLIEDRALVFRDLLESQSDVARKLLPAIARRKCVQRPTAAEFLKEAHLSASSVRSALADLTARDIVYRSSEGYLVYERLFGEWLRGT